MSAERLEEGLLREIQVWLFRKKASPHGDPCLSNLLYLMSNVNAYTLLRVNLLQFWGEGIPRKEAHWMNTFLGVERRHLDPSLA